MAKKIERKSVLIIRFSALGDVALALPSIYNVCRLNPDIQFIFLTRKLPAKMFVNKPANLIVEGVDTKLYSGVAGVRRLFSELRKRYDFELVVDLHDVLRSKLLRLFSKLAGLKTVKIDKGRREKKEFVKRGAVNSPQLKHTTQRYIDTFEKAGLHTVNDIPALFENGKADDNCFSAASSPKKDGERWIAVAPFAAHAGKIYPLQKMGEIIDALSADNHNKIFIFGAGEHEKQEIEKMRRNRDNVVNLAEKMIGLPAELALMSRCDVMLAMDSANMHLASLVGLPVVSVWGATHAGTGFYGIGQHPENRIETDLECRPCSVYGNKKCKFGDYRCLTGISPQTIIEKINTIIKPAEK